MPELADEARLHWAVESAGTLLLDSGESKFNWIRRSPSIEIDPALVRMLCEFTGEASASALTFTRTFAGETYINARELRRLYKAAWHRAQQSPMRGLFPPQATASAQRVPAAGLTSRRQLRRRQANSRAIAGAIANLVPGERARWAEEWAADLDDMTGAVRAWKWRLGLRLNARRMSPAAAVRASPRSGS